MRNKFVLASLSIILSVSASATVYVTSPTNNSNVTSPVNFVATATAPNCPAGVASMGIYTAPGQLAYVVQGASLNTNLNLEPGTYNTVVQEWDKCNGASKTQVTITVTSGGGGGNTFWSLQSDTSGWTGYGLLPPSYQICNSCPPGGPKVSWSWTPNDNPSPSKDGKATKTTIGGNEAYSDVLWNNHLIGDFSSQGMPDPDHKIVPTLHDFTYDVWFYLSDNSKPQALEFDINQFFNNQSYIWGNECRVAGGHEWDTWNNPGGYWVPSGFSCNPVVGWNHLVIQVQRTSNNQLLWKSISLNGNVNNINRTDNPSTTNGWYGVTINYQIDGNYAQQGYAVYLDELNFTYK